MKKIAIIGLDRKEGLTDFLNSLVVYESKYNIQFVKYIYSSKEFSHYDKLPDDRYKKEEFVCAISVGGDGTFLYTSRIFAGIDVPILGLNLGFLGFNTNIELNEFEYFLSKFLNNNIDYDYKDLLEISIEGIEEKFIALNEGVISHLGISRMIHLKVDLENLTIYDFKGDGLIISSPTGSTAYNLSAGGPILHPSVNSFVITPICPHTLAIRPYIVPFEEKINITILESSAIPQITLDGQKIIILNIGQKISFNKSPKKVKIIKGNKNFSEILKIKLGWMN